MLQNDNTKNDDIPLLVRWRDEKSLAWWVMAGVVCSAVFSIFSFAGSLVSVSVGDFVFFIIFFLSVIVFAQSIALRKQRSLFYWLGSVLYAIASSSLYAGYMALPNVIVAVLTVLGLYSGQGGAWSLLVPFTGIYFVVFLLITILSIGACVLAGSINVRNVFGKRNSPWKISATLLTGAFLSASSTIFNSVVLHSKQAFETPLDLFFYTLLILGPLVCFAVMVKQKWIFLYESRVAPREAFEKPPLSCLALATLIAGVGFGLIGIFPSIQPKSSLLFLGSMSDLGGGLVNGQIASMNEAWSNISNALLSWGLHIAFTSLAFFMVSMLAFFLFRRDKVVHAGIAILACLLLSLAYSLTCESLNLVLYRLGSIFNTYDAYLTAIAILNATIVPIALASLVVVSSRLRLGEDTQ